MRRSLAPAHFRCCGLAGVLSAAVVASLALLYWLGITHHVERRFASLVHGDLSHEVRLVNWRDAWDVGRDFWCFGTGLGTYRYAYLPYQKQFAESWFYHAENQFLEAFTEAGIVGVAILLAAVLLQLRCVIRLISLRSHHERRASGFVGLFALVGQVVHELFDFGLYLPANMIGFSLLCGAVAGGAANLDRPRSALLRGLRSRPFVCLVAMMLGINGCLGLREVCASTTADELCRELPALDDYDTLDQQEVDLAIRRLTTASDRRPDDAELRVRLADLWIFHYRQQTYDQWLNNLAVDVEVSRNELWKRTSIAYLHCHANDLYRQQGAVAVEPLRRDPRVIKNLDQARKHLLAAQRACPILPRIDLKLATLALLTDTEPPSGEVNLRRAIRLTPADPDVLFAAGLLAMNAGLDELAYHCWRNSWTLSERYKQSIVALTAPRLAPAEMVSKVLPESPSVLLQLARTDYASDKFHAVRVLLIGVAKQRLLREEKQIPADERYRLQALVHDSENRHGAAVSAYRCALSLRPFETDWRLELVSVLQRQGKLDEAYQEAHLCAALAPERNDVRKLVADVNKLRLRQASAER